jgi:iron-sulfur cluster assembly protein
MIKLTEKAVAEVKRIVAEQEQTLDKVYLRVGVKGGGCSGWSWVLNLDEVYSDQKDLLEEQDGVQIIVDNRSAMYVDGTAVDYYDDGLMKRGFVCTNSNVKSTCGCGSSVSF